MRWRWSGVLGIGFGVIVIGVIAGRAAAPGSPPSASSVGQLPATPAARDKVAEVTGIVWFANEIENAAIEKLILVPPKGSPPLPPRPTVYDWIQKLLAQTRAGIAGLTGGDQCAYDCPPGICDPGCSPPRPLRPLPTLKRPPLDRAIPAIRWSTNALENTALEKLMAGVPYAKIRQSLTTVLTQLKTGP